MLRSSPGPVPTQTPSQPQQNLSPSPKSSRKSRQRSKFNGRVEQLYANDGVLDGPLTATITPVTQLITNKEQDENNGEVGFRSASHKSLNRQKWPPSVHTIAKASESFTGTVSSAKLFDDVKNSYACQPKAVDSCGMNNDCSYGTHGALAPSLESNVATHQENVKVEEQKEDSIPMDILLSDIRRLTVHEFDGQSKPASYPTILEPLYQRLYDYHVCLKSARERAGEINARSKLNTSSSAYQKNISNNSFSVHKTNTHPKNSAASSFTALHSIVSARQAEFSRRTLALEEKILDLEKQLAQSRKAHHGLLQNHILNFAASMTISASCIALSRLMTTTTTITTTSTIASLTKNDASAILSILASVPNIAVPGTRNVEVDNAVLARSQISLQNALKVAKENLQARQFSTSENNCNVTERRLIKAPMAIECSPNASLATLSLKDHPTPLNDATTRLLRAETELGLLKLIMAQSQQEILGLEEEVFRKQTELTYHRKVFENILGLNQLGREMQIWEEQVQIKELMGQVKKIEQEREVIENTVKRLETEIKALEIRLGKKREEQESQEPEMNGRARDLEAVIAQLRQELESQPSRVKEMEQLSIQAEEAPKRDHEELETTKAMLQEALEAGDDECMVDHLEKEHNEANMALRANPVQGQKTNKRLDDSRSSPIPSKTPIEDMKAEDALKFQITALETQVEELTSTLRLKDIELEQAQEVSGKHTLQLEADLERQRRAHKEEMEKFAAEKELQAQCERSCQTASIILFQDMVSKLQNELSGTSSEMRTTLPQKKDLGETTKHLREVEQTVVKLGDAISMLKAERDANLALVRA
ncbi:hypothetical protein BGZ46_008758 [Entomortierella lignicola]|nr:hypothetical protein BGZ46_008758 [Entomortierella lignicola]